MNILSKIFHKKYITGKNNKVVAIKNGIEYKILNNKSTLKIKGNNNTVVLNCDNCKNIQKILPNGLLIDIDGNNNRMELEMPLKFNNAKLNMQDDNNKITIKTTKKKIKDVWIMAGKESEVFIDTNSSIGQGDFSITANGNYKEGHKVLIGKNFRPAKDVIIRTSDGHSLIDINTGIATNSPQDVIIEDDVWIMTRSMILKGSKISKGSAVAAYSLVNKKFDEENILLAGIPAKILKHNIKWDVRSYGAYMSDFEKEKEICR